MRKSEGVQTDEEVAVDQIIDAVPVAELADQMLDVLECRHVERFRSGRNGLQNLRMSEEWVLRDHASDRLVDARVWGLDEAQNFEFELLRQPDHLELMMLASNEDSVLRTGLEAEFTKRALINGDPREVEKELGTMQKGARLDALTGVEKHGSRVSQPVVVE